MGFFFRALFLGLIFFRIAEGAPPNDKIVITDWMDDDQKAQIYDLLSNPKGKSRIKAIVVTSGNVQLKAASLRQFLAGMGRDDVQVLVGTSIDLSKDSATVFAADHEYEGEPFLSANERRELNLQNGIHGGASGQLARMFKQYSESGKRLDVELLSAPTDLQLAISHDPGTASKALGDLYSMGLYSVEQNGLTPKFNAKVDRKSALALFDLLATGVFQRHFTIPTSTVQRNSGLAGGYFPEDSAKLAYRQRLTSVMQSIPVLNKTYQAGQRYRRAFLSSVARREGWPAFVAWIAGATKNPDDGAAFYTADGLVSMISQMSETQLQGAISRGEIKTRRVKAHWDGATQELVYQEDPKGALLYEFQSLPGEKFVTSLVELMEQARAQNSIQPTDQFHLRTENLPRPTPITIERDHGANPEALLLSFKNSPDDWYGLYRLLGTNRGRTALAHGGIVVEGIETTAVGDALMRALKDLGITNIEVAVSSPYSLTDAKLPNLRGEYLAYQNGLGVRAFAGLPAADRPLLTPRELFARSAAWSQQTGGRIDAIVYGQGKDFLTYANGDPALKQALRRVLVMGGARIKDGKTTLTRNWLIGQDPSHPYDHLKPWDDLGRSGVTVDILPTSEFGAALVASGTANHGNFAFNRLAGAAPGSALNRSADHARFWSASWEQIEADSFDPNYRPEQIQTSLLGVAIPDLWLMDTQMESDRVDLAHWLENPRNPISGNVNILRAPGGLRTEDYLLRLQASIDALEARREISRNGSTIPVIPSTPLEPKFHDLKITSVRKCQVAPLGVSWRPKIARLWAKLRPSNFH